MKNNSKWIALVIVLGLSAGSSAQSVSADTGTVKKDSVKKALDPRAQIKPYDEVIRRGYSTKAGLFTVHTLKDTMYYEIPQSILHCDIEVINRLEQGPGGSGTYSGEELDEKTIFFEYHQEDSTVRIRYDLVISSADSTSTIYKAVRKSNLDPVVMSFPVKAYGPGEKSYVIDVSKWVKDAKCVLNSVDPNVGLSRAVNTGGPKDISIDQVHAYPNNVEFTISKNADSKGSPALPATFVTHSSFIELPATPMQQRIADPRVGFFQDQEYHFSDDQQRVEDRRFALRWRLEPKDEDVEKWKRGELVEPKKPIVIYIDPATPKQWRPYLIAGINDWQKAFEQAGFKNAIWGKEWPEQDTTMQMDDARYSMLNYLPSEISNAYGPQIHDPRSGEIIQTHIGWYHNVMEIVHSWYMIQAGAVDPRARHVKFDDDLMGQLIRFVSSHEVGHTLGLQHNWGASSQTPVDSLRSKHYLDAHGHTSSIMDYARFDYVAQPEDNIPEYDIFPHIGEYDRWAIEWGYRYISASTAEEDKKFMRKLTTDSLSKNSRLLWLGVQGSPDPRIQNEDLGDDAARASIYGIRNLKRILPHLPEWTHEDGGEYENLDEMYKALKDQYLRYMQHVMRNVGGTWKTLRSEDQTGDVFTPVPRKLQEEAVDFFNSELFETPYWLMDEKVLTKVSTPAQPDFVEDLQVKALNKLLDIGTMGQLLANMRQFPEKAYPLDEYINSIHKGIWKELRSGKPIDPYRRNLQKSYIGAMQSILLSSSADNTETDAFSITRADMVKLQKEIDSAIPITTDRLTKYHLQDLQVRIRKTFEANPVIQ